MTPIADILPHIATNNATLTITAELATITSTPTYGIYSTVKMQSFPVYPIYAIYAQTNALNATSIQSSYPLVGVYGIFSKATGSSKGRIFIKRNKDAKGKGNENLHTNYISRFSIYSHDAIITGEN